MRFQTQVPLVLLALPLSLGLGGCGKEPAAPAGDRVAGIPEGWGGGSPSSYAIGTDYTNYRSGAAAVYLTSLTQNPASFATITQLVRADNYRGRRVRWSGWVRPSGIGGQGAGLWMRVDGPGTVQAFDNMLGARSILGSDEWKMVSVVLDVADDAMGLALGALLSGPGDLIVDDLLFEVVGTDVLTTDKLAAPQPGADSTTLAAVYADAPSLPTNLDFETPTGPAAQVAVALRPTRVPR
jgi:hypothetical protein